MKNRILVITRMFPREDKPFFGIFIHNRIRYLSDKEYITVIAPVSIISIDKSKRTRFILSFTPYKQKINGLLVYHPRYLSIPTAGILKYLFKLDIFLFSKSVLHCIRKNKIIFDIIHSQFILPAGRAGMVVSKRYHVPHILTSGESSFYLYKKEFSPCLCPLSW